MSGPRPDDASTGEPVVARGARVVAVALSQEHGFSKQTRAVVRLLEGLGVEGDAHAGTTVQHLSRVRRDPTEANLRQVHLLSSELFGEVGTLGYEVLPGQMGENITTAGVDLLALPVGTTLMLGDTAEVVLTGLRNPCRQIDAFRPGLLKQVLGKDEDGSVVRRAGVMGLVRHGGEVRPGDAVTVVLPEEPHRPLRTV